MRVQVAPESVLRRTRALSLMLPLAYTVAGEEGEKARSRKTPWAAKPGSELQESPPFVLLRIPPLASVAHRRNDDVACSPSCEVRPPYFLTMAKYWETAGTTLAASSGS